MAGCELHGDHEARIKHLEDWKKEHTLDSNTVRENLYNAINSVRNRLPVWATCVISLLVGLIGYLSK